ncbi:uncharacterized protein MONOS_7345 [Monocercomonoides exilis]|uniref:uncharacterized protein n=1 Tax=Monocercomonoides exilis TaxID=2049356 RepID=UPI00355A032F|nr:hypothetical protein MONOS_7345 [Monocercomonoides exilis]|eukprot:MONOS_7345.1-p1 / transcript=MONOS_7345.1 / gene=MONOS_7345 / organism=Monocercomonoides_exilis_PA203 / gene_product=unspecified product / transcript_product=unspecified product / location=Mono_scaffold00249:17655-18104(-) / protein_length=150 / sequence_SO=supercontig / SO=protein_coding / is_pseudo=false
MQFETKSSPELRLYMQIAPPLDIPSETESSDPDALDPFHSHQINELTTSSVVFCLPGFNGFSLLPMNSIFLVPQHPTNEVFEAVREANGLFREWTIPPSYTSQIEENEQLLIKIDVFQKEVVGYKHVSFAVEILKKSQLKEEYKGNEGQ